MRHGEQLQAFIKEFQDEFCKRVEKYAEYSKKERFEPSFCHSEQQTKTHITAALDAVCDSNFLQEYRVWRQRKVKHHRRGYGRSIALSKGKVDYRCGYEMKDIKIKILLEMKQNWIRYSPTPPYQRKPGNEWRISAACIKAHKEAIDDLGSIWKELEQRGDNTENLYGLALTLLPLYCGYPWDAPSTQPVKIPEDSMAQIGREAQDAANADAHGTFIVQPHLDGLVPRGEGYYNGYESYPGMVFLWSVPYPKSTEKT